MDPNLFHLDWNRVGEGLITLIILSMLIERALSIVFEHRLFIKKFDKKGLKEIIAFIVSFAVCWIWQFDIISMVLVADTTSHVGEFITAAVIAGGSKGSIKLFNDIMDLKSTAKRNQENEDKQNLLNKGAAA